MNNQRRKSVKEVIKQLKSLQETLEQVRDEEEEAYDNLPEGIQDSEKGETMMDNVTLLDEQTGAIDDIIGELEGL